jgi:hypothetical protein
MRTGAITERPYIEAEIDGIQQSCDRASSRMAEYDQFTPPQSYADIPRYLAEVNDFYFERDLEARERAVNPSEMCLREVLTEFSDAGRRAERVTAMYPVYAEEHGAAKARRYVPCARRSVTHGTAAKSYTSAST